MIELDFSNANIVVEDNLVFTQPITETTSIKIDRSAILISDIVTEKDIVANYSIIAFGNVNAANIRVLQDFVCFGTVKCNSLHVTGSFKCFKDLLVKDVYIGKSAYINSGMIESDSTIEGNLFVAQTIEANGSLTVSKNIICNEGIIGSGRVKCSNIIASEYMQIEVHPTGKKLILDELANEKAITLPDNKRQEETAKDINKEYTQGVLSKVKRLSEVIKNQPQNKALELNNIIYDKELMNFIDTLKGINDFVKGALEDLISIAENDMEYEKIGNIILSSSHFNPSFKDHHNIFKQILEWSEKRPERNIVSFLKFVDLKRKTPDYMKKISICKDFFEIFVEKEKGYISEMSVNSIKDHQQFTFNLTLLEQNRGQFSEDEYLLLLEKLYSVIGIKPTMIKKFISIGG